MKMLGIGVMVAGALAAGAVFAAQSGADVVRAKGCNNCHAKVGPSFKDIAAKKGDPAALSAKLKEGKGHPKVNASDADIKAAVDYVLSQK
jgi:cytochrome c551/c552